MALTTTQSALVDRTLIKLDALDAPGSSIVGSRGEVYQVLQEASRQLILECPSKLLHGVTTDGATDANDEIDTAALSSSAYVLVPLEASFLRLMGLRLSGWRRTLYHADLEEGEGADGLVYYREGGKAPSSSTPVAYVVFYSSDSWTTGKSAIQVFPGTDEASPLEDFRFVSVTAPESLPDALTEPLLWKAAGMLSRAIAPDIGRLCDAEYARAMGLRSMSRQHRTTRAYRGL